MSKNRYYPIRIDLPPEYREALRAVVDYLWDAECADCEANPAPNHIFAKLALLRELSELLPQQEGTQLTQVEARREQLAEKWAKQHQKFCDQQTANEDRPSGLQKSCHTTRAPTLTQTPPISSPTAYIGASARELLSRRC